MNPKYVTILTASLILTLAALPITAHPTPTPSTMIEVTTEACGIDGYTPKTVSLTTEQYQDYQHYLDTFHQRLTAATTQHQVITLYKDAFHKLDSLNLLPTGMTLTQAMRLADCLDRLTARPHLPLKLTNIDDNQNLRCLIAGKTTATWFTPPIVALFALLLFIPNNSIQFLAFIGLILSQFIVQATPISHFCTLNLGDEWYEWEGTTKYDYTTGWVHTHGLAGPKDWDGTLRGALPINGVNYGAMTTTYTPYPAALGFIGIKTSSYGKTCF